MCARSLKAGMRASQMTRMLAIAATVAAIFVGAVVAQSRPQDVDLQAAIRTAAVTGDLKVAIQQFKAIIAKYPDDRATAAKALLELAECYRRLGDDAAQGVLRQIVRDYRDQTDVVSVARARLAPAESEVTSNPNRRWTVPDSGSIAGPVSYDGRYLAFVDWSDAGKGDLFVHAFGGGGDRRVTASRNVQDTSWKEFPERAAFSRDGRQVAYSWADLDTGRYQLRIAALTGIASPQARVLVDVEAPAFVDPYDWSADGHWIAALWKEKEGNSPRTIGLVSTKDGSRRELKSLNRPCACDLTLSLSPDGKYLAFDLPGVDTRQRDIFVLDTATGGETPAVVYQGDDALVGWAPDGRSLIFTSNRRTSATDLFAVPFAAGRAGTAAPIRTDLGAFFTSGVTGSGAIYYCRCERQAGSDIKIASFDFATGRFLSPPADAVQQFVGTNFQPFWSPDGASFVYRSQRPNQDPMLVIQDVASGDARELRPKLSQFQSPRWAPDGRSIAVMGRDFNNRFGWYRVDAQTGRSEAIIIYPPGSSLWELSPETSWSPDGRTLSFRRHVRGVEFLFVDLDVASGQEHVHVRLPGQDALPLALSSDRRTLYYQRPAAGGAGSEEIVLVSRDLASGTEHDLLRRASMGMRNDMLRLSPDGRLVATVVDPSADKSSVVLVIPRAGGQAREVFRTDAADVLSVALWAPNGGSLLVRTRASPEKPSDFWWVPLDGRATRKLTEFETLRPTGLFLHPDGRQILFGARADVTAPAMPTEVWVLEGVIRK